MAHPLTLPTKPSNRIFTGVAGTGKTYHLLQLQRLYDEQVDDKLEVANAQVKTNLLSQYSWVNVICAVFLLENRTLSVAEIKRHALVQDKMHANQRDANIHQTLWNALGAHSHPESTTVNYANRSSNYYFDKDENSRWYLLEEVKDSLQDSLAQLLNLYQLNVCQLNDNTVHAKSSQADQISHSNQANLNHISRTSFVSFHQSYGYDEFVEGIRPQIDPATGQMRYHIQAGAFIQLCQRAMADPEHRYAMLIDEINRANTAQVFGELMSVIEPDKRAGQRNAMQVTLAYSGRQIIIPSNVDIYATMNTQDHSLTALDDAFRRRFEFIEMRPDSALLPTLHDNKGDKVQLSALMDAINQRMAEQLGSEVQLGQAYFYDVKTLQELAQRFARQILPQLIHNVQNVVTPIQQYEVLSYILYGNLYPELHADAHTNNANHIADDINLLQSNLSNQKLTSDNSNPPRTSQSLLDIVDTIESLTDKTEITESSIYLTAKPYQMIYADFKDHNAP